jgi:hypothetical protein
MGAKFTRRRFLEALGAAAAYLALAPAAGCDLLGHTSRPKSLRIPTLSPFHATKVWPLPSTSSATARYVQAFRSRPDLSPATVEATTRRAQDTATGYIFIAPKKGAGQDGPMIIDNLGHLVWFGKNRYATDFKVQSYRGEPVLTWWEGRIVGRHGVGEYMIFDGSYRKIARVRAGNGYQGDLHEFLITPQDTALLTVYVPMRTDLSSVGGPQDGAVWDGIAQEVDIETGKVLFEWHSLEHVSVEESYGNPPADPAYIYDYFHINSIDVDLDNNLLISSRNTWTVYKLDRKSGEILWRLGGKRSDFEMRPGTQTAFQHDARRHEDGTITIFDNGAGPVVHDQSRGIVVELDMDEMSAKLVREYTSPQKRLSTSQGNMQILPNANVFIGWGSAPFFSEYNHDGEPLFDASFLGKAQSYRAFRFPWSGRPIEDPAVAVEQSPDDKVALYASWNGATEFESWEVIVGPHPGQLRSLGSVPREGFETAMLVQTADPYVAVRAKGRLGQTLGTSAPIKL